MQRRFPFLFIGVAYIEKKATNILISDISSVSVAAAKTGELYTLTEGRAQYKARLIPRSVDLRKTTIESMALYAMCRLDVSRLERRFGDLPCLLGLDSLVCLRNTCTTRGTMALCSQARTGVTGDKQFDFSDY